jgi:hypothetical protein
MEPRWRHGKKAIAEPARTLAAHALIARICAYYHWEHEEHIAPLVG